MTNPSREQSAFDPQLAVEALLAARNSGAALDDLPARGRPETPEQAYAIQDAVARNLGPVAAWKVGVDEGQVAEWRVYADNEPIRRLMAKAG